MSKTVKIVLIVVAVAIVAYLAYWYYNKKKAAPKNVTIVPNAPVKAPIVANAGTASTPVGSGKNDTKTNNE